ncbi:MAG: hypothetical protein HY689_05225 [Chloroflexi bacterium]|nr:hypothetical protein [Chloroflexota bacterium]
MARRSPYQWGDNLPPDFDKPTPPADHPAEAPKVPAAAGARDSLYERYQRLRLRVSQERQSRQADGSSA